MKVKYDITEVNHVGMLNVLFTIILAVYIITLSCIIL